MEFTVWSVFARTESLRYDEPIAAQDLKRWRDGVGLMGVHVRGIYDVSGMREEADLLLWMHGPTMQGLQESLRAFRRTAAGESVELVWSAMGRHDLNEAARGHIQGFAAGEQPRPWVSVCPYGRSEEWYSLTDDERRDLIVDRAGVLRHHSSVLVTMVPAFALTDYEWLQALEADHVGDLIDITRALRTSASGAHIRDEPPYYTGRRLDFTDVIEVLR